MSYEPDDIKTVFTGTEYQFGFDIDGVLCAITKPECRICRCTWGPVIDEHEDDNLGRDFNAYIAELTAERDMLAKVAEQACRVAQFTEGTGEYTGDCAGWLYADDGCEMIADVPELAAYLRQKQAPTDALTTPKEDSNGN